LFLRLESLNYLVFKIG